MGKEIDSLKEFNQQDIDLDIVQKILFVVVLYETNLYECSTYKSLCESVKDFHHDLRVDLLVCDNSSYPQTIKDDNNSNDCFNIYYLHDSGNPGISLSYNRAAEFALFKGKNWLFVMDQDTTFPVSALSEYIWAINQFPNFPLYAPIVYDDKGLMLSPCGYKLYRGYPLSGANAGINSSVQKNVINSGLLLDLEAYKDVNGYDESVWLYFSDFIFFNRLKKKYKEFILVNCQLKHELSSSDYTNYEFAIKRFRYYCEGAKAASVSDSNFGSLISYSFTVGMRSVLMSWRFRKLSFFKLFMTSFF